MAFASVGAPAATTTTTTTTNPLKAACSIDAATCEGVGTTNSFYNGQNVSLLYTQGYFCDTAVSSAASSKCEAGAPYQNLPPGTPSVSYTDPLYIPVPLFTPGPSGLQCPAGSPCIDHPHTIDLSRIASALGASPSSVQNAMLPGHDHVVTNLNGNKPEWWPVVVVGVKSAASWNAITTAKSYSEIQKLQAQKNSGVTANVPTNAFLYFQVLPGTVPAAQAATASTAVPAGTAPSATSGATIDNLVNDCTNAAAGQCENIGLTHDWLGGQTVGALYSQQFFCDTTVSAHSSSGCEAGQAYNHLPPGVPSAQYTDPLYIPVPLFSPGPGGLQCAAGAPCIDHPGTIDLSRLASALKASPAALQNAMLPGHDHIITTRNGNQPEWWPVDVVGVTSPVAWNKIIASKSLTEVQALQAQQNSGVTATIPTNAFLWFQTLPGLLPNVTVASATVPTATTPAATATTPLGAPQTGAGGTSGTQDGWLFVLAGLALAGSAGTLAVRRRRLATGADS